MNVLVLMLVFIYVAGNESEDLPLLNTGDVGLENLTDSSVVLTWTLKEREDKHMENTTEKLRLLIHLETDGKPPLYMTPGYSNRECSLSVSQCRLTFLTHDTKYKVIVSIDDVKHSTLLGYDIVKFTTLAIEEPGDLLKKILLYVVLPGMIGIIIIVFTLVVVCAKCCRCLCWRQHNGKQQVSDSGGQQQNVNETHQQFSPPQEIRMCDHYDQPHESEISHQESGRYLSVISEQQQQRQQQQQQQRPTSPHHFEVGRHPRKDRTCSSSSSASTSRQTPLDLDTLIAQHHHQQQQQQQQQQQHPLRHHHRHHKAPPSPPHHKRWPVAGRPVQGEPELDYDGYLEVVDPAEQYSNGLNML